MGYSNPGESGIFPFDAILNLPIDIYSHGIRKAIAFEVSKNSFSEAVDSIKRYTGVKVHKRPAEILSQKAAQDFDEYYEQMCTSLQLEEAKRLPLLVLTTYQIEKWVRTPESVSGEFTHTGKPLNRPRPKAKRVWARLEKNAEQVINDLFFEPLFDIKINRNTGFV